MGGVFLSFLGTLWRGINLARLGGSGVTLNAEGSDWQLSGKAAWLPRVPNSESRVVGVGGVISLSLSVTTEMMIMMIMIMMMLIV